MKAVRYHSYGDSSVLVHEEAERPAPGPGQVVLQVAGTAFNPLDVAIRAGYVQQDFPVTFPHIPNYDVAGVITGIGEGVTGFATGERVGVPWLGWTCGKCRYCLAGQENLCDFARFTGCSIDGGYADYTVADARFCFRLPKKYADAEAAPLLCAGLIGHRAHRMAGEASGVVSRTTRSSTLLAMKVRTVRCIGPIQVDCHASNSGS